VSAGFELDRGRIRLGDAALVYLERALAPPEPLPPGEVPRAYGLAPAAVVGDAVVAALGPGEVVWLGFQAVDRERPAVLRVRLDAPEPLDAVTGERWAPALADEPRNHVVCPPDSRLGVLDAPEFTVLCCAPVEAQASVRLVAPEEFTRLTGEVPPALDEASGFGGYRLP
jgi:hypothetical protein